MAANIKMRFPNERDIIDLAEYMRQADIDELEAVCDLSPLDAVRASVRLSDPNFLFAAHADGRLLCIGGVSVEGAPWLLATDLMFRYSKRLTRDARRGVRMMLEKYPILSNVVDARHARAIRWLEAIGFEMKEMLEIKPGFAVLRFEIRIW